MVSLSFAFCLNAVAPAVVVPLMIGLLKDGYGLKKQIPIKIIASATLENLTILIIFGITSVFVINTFASKEQSVGTTIGMSILQIVVGFLGGIILAIPGFLFKVKELHKLNNNVVKFIFCFIVILGM